jgi:hypothetical protein
MWPSSFKSEATSQLVKQPALLPGMRAQPESGGLFVSVRSWKKGTAAAGLGAKKAMARARAEAPLVARPRLGREDERSPEVVVESLEPALRTESFTESFR